MATKGYIDHLLNALPTDLRYPLRSAFYYLMDTWRFGDDVRAENAQLYRLTSTTASVANTEFSIVHGMGAAPHQLLPVLDLTDSNAQLVPLKVSRPADAQRIYLQSSSTSASFTIYAEL